MKPLNRIVFSGDWHCGSRWGLIPPDWQQQPHCSYAASWMWDAWLEYWATAKRPDLLCLMGDLIDGTQYRSEGTTLLTSSLQEQVEMAMAVFEAIPARKRPHKIIRVRGTAYHESHHGPLAVFDEKFNVYKPLTPEQEIVLDIKLPDDRVLNVKHTPEGSAALYLGTVQDRELLWAKVTEINGGIPKATFLVRAHLHMMGRHDGHGKVLVNNPCWSLQAPYALNKRRYRWQPVIGNHSLVREPEEPLGWAPRCKPFTLPKMEAVTYAEI